MAHKLSTALVNLSPKLCPSLQSFFSQFLATLPFGLAILQGKLSFVKLQAQIRQQCLKYSFSLNCPNIIDIKWVGVIDTPIGCQKNAISVLNSLVKSYRTTKCILEKQDCINLRVVNGNSNGSRPKFFNIANTNRTLSIQETCHIR